MTNGCTNKAAWLLSIAAGLSCSTAAFAQSDSCAGATLVTNGTYAYDLAGATNEGNSASACGATGTAEDVWFAYTSANAGNLVLSTCGLTSGDSVLAAYSDCATQIACQDDFCGLQTQLTVPVSAGQTVLIRIADFFGGTHAGSISITGPGGGPPPGSNDTCANAIVANNGNNAFDTTGYTTDGPTECLFFGDNQVNQDGWFRYTATATGNLQMTLCDLAFYDSKIAIYNGFACPGVTSSIACNDDFCGLISQITTPVTIGQQLLLRVGGYGLATGAGSFNLSISAAPTTDTCAQAVDVSAGGTFAFDTTGATNDTAGVCGATAASPDTWFAYTATTDGTVVATTCGLTGLDTVLSWYADCPANTLISCLDDSCGLQTRLGIDVFAGNTYYLRLAGFANQTGSGSINISMPPPCEISQPAGSVVEAELCGEDLNGGCNIQPNAFEAIACGNTVIYGQAHTFVGPLGQTRDTDWYSLTTFADSTITATLTADFAGATFILSGGCSALVAEAFGTTADGCETVTISAFVPAGTYYIFAGPSGFTGNECSTGNNEYVLEVSTDGGCTPTGACCLTTSCSIISEADCGTAGGNYLGDASACENPGNYDLVAGQAQFSDISSFGTEVFQGDDTFVNVSVGFNFNFYGTDYSDAFIGSNGYVTFGAGSGVFGNGPIPSAGGPNNAAYALWDDFNFNDGGRCYYATLGTAGVDLRFVAQWTNVPQFAAGGDNSFQAILYENGSIEYRYGAVDGFATGDATIGIENADGTVASSADGDTIGTGGNSYIATYTPGSDNCVGGCASDLTPCRADQDGDDDIDSDDINLFFAAFEAGDSCGDQDGDDDVDSDDINIFFAAFEAGGC